MQVATDPDGSGGYLARVKAAADQKRCEGRASKDSKEASDCVVDHDSTVRRSAAGHNGDAST